MNTDNKVLDKDISNIVFKSVTDEEIDILRHYFNLNPCRSCDYSVGGVLIWKNYFDYKYTVIDDSLLLMGSLPESDIKVFYKPCGKIESKKYFTLIKKYCQKNDIKGIVVSPEEYLPTENEDPRPTDDVFMTDWMEYLYDIDKFVSFSGHKYGKKRNHLNYFLNHFPEFEVKTICSDLATDIIDFTKDFNDTHTESKISEYECHELIKVLRDYDKYPYHGIAIYYNDKVIGYSFGECIGDTMIVHAEKGNIRYGGIYQAIASRFAISSLEKYPDLKYLNREDDMGSEELRKSKLSYHPTLFIAKKIDNV